MGNGLRSAVFAAVAIIALVWATAAQAATPEVGSPAGQVDLRGVDGAQRHGLGHAIPLKGARPSWYTDDLAAKVDAANGTPVAAPNDAPLPGEVGIRPGAWMIEPYGCTMNFVFGSPGSYSIGTAAHCTDKVGQSVVLLTLAPGSGNPVLVEIGSVTKDSGEGDIGNDFSLVSIKSQLQSWVSPTNAVIGGPCGRYFGYDPKSVFHYGHGLGIGTGGTPRAGLALTWKRDAFGWSGAAIFGDSGSSVRIDTLQAAGNLTHLVVDTRWLPSYIAGTRIEKMEQIAGVPMANSPLCLSTSDLGSPSGGGSDGGKGGGNGGGNGGGKGGPKKSRG